MLSVISIRRLALKSYGLPTIRNENAEIQSGNAQMRLGLSTLLLLIAIVCLGIVLANQKLVPSLVTIEKHNDIWLLSDDQLARSRWEDLSTPPPISQKQALDTANRIMEFFADREEQLWFGDLTLESVSIVRIEFEQPSWAYQIFISARSNGQRGYPQLSFLLLMDGTIAFDPDWQPGLTTTIHQFGSPVEFVGSMSE